MPIFPNKICLGIIEKAQCLSHFSPIVPYPWLFLGRLGLLMIIFVRDRTARCRRPLRRGACRKNAECGTWFNSEFGMRNAELFVGKGSAYIKPFRYICRGGACRLPKTWAKFSLLKKLGALNQKRASSRKQYTLRKKCARSSGNRKGRPYEFNRYNCNTNTVGHRTLFSRHSVCPTEIIHFQFSIFNF